MSDDPYPSPFDRFGSESIPAGVSDGRRLHGYAVAGDLARHYSFAETLYLLATGELPTDEVGRRFEVALFMSMGVTIADASVHAARVVRHVHSRGVAPTVAATAGIGIAEHARYVLDRHEGWLEWLDSDRETGPPGRAVDSSGDDQETIRAFAELAEGSCLDQLLEHSPTLTAAALALLRECGLTRPEQLATALVVARFPVAMAEAFSVEDSRLWKYPLNLPFWVYEPEEEE